VFQIFFSLVRYLGSIESRPLALVCRNTNLAVDTDLLVKYGFCLRMWILISPARNGIGQIFFLENLPKVLIHPIIHPRSVAVNHAGLWIRRHQFESGRGYLYLSY
jgi:hypothetical protein